MYIHLLEPVYFNAYIKPIKVLNTKKTQTTSHKMIILIGMICVMSLGTQWRIQESDDMYAHFRNNE